MPKRYLNERIHEFMVESFRAAMSAPPVQQELIDMSAAERRARAIEKYAPYAGQNQG